MGKIDVPFMRRYIRTFGQIAQIAKVALLNDIKKVVLFNAINFHGFGFIDQVKQGWKGITQADAAAATMADIIDAL